MRFLAAGLAAGVSIVSAAAFPVWAEQDRAHGASPPEASRRTDVPPDEVLEAAGTRIGAVIVRVGDIFDPEHPREARRLYRWVNRLHRKTRRRVVERLLLFQSGDAYSGRLLAESERLLRAAGVFYDARVRPVRYEHGLVDVLVETRDVWTLRAGARFRRAGGANSGQLGIKDKNFLGWGSELALERRRGIERRSTRLTFRDPNLFGKRLRTELQWARSDDGSERGLIVQRPFFSLDARRAAGVRYESFSRTTPLYDLGAVAGRLPHRSVVAEVFAGWSRGLKARRAWRWSLGATYTRDELGAVTGTLPGLGAFHGASRRFLYPWIGIARVEDRYAVARDVDRLGRTEDVNLGREFSLRLGLASRDLGSTASRGMVRVWFRDGMGDPDGRMVHWRLGAEGRLAGGEVENGLFEAEARFYLREQGGDLLFASLNVAAGTHLDPERQILLGGDTGLRGYPLRYFRGDRKVLATLEQRFFTSWEPLGLVHVGAAVFLDLGSAWTSGSGGASRGGVYKDIGVGLRFGSTRSAHGSLVHVDLAMPLDAEPGVPHLQLLVTTHGSF